jgi:hypothetical protein
LVNTGANQVKANTVDELFKILAPLVGAFSDFDQRISVAEQVFQKHSPALWEEYQTELNDLKMQGSLTKSALSLEALRKELLQDHGA